jgi:hypothetical protein
LAVIHHARDNSFKLIFGDPELFVEFLRDFIPISLLKDISPENIEDMSERFLPLFQDARDSDTIKRIRLKDGSTSLYVIAIVEHESEVNHRSSFKMLQYITLVLTEYEKEANKAKKGASLGKNFKFPPVLPIVFYDGANRWTAETNFLNKTEMSDVFGKYIPTFEYELIALNQYSEADLTQFGDILSLIMIIDKIQRPDDLSLLSKLPPDYAEQLDNLNIPEHLRKLIANVITVLLARINVPKEEIEQVTEKIYQSRRFQEMFTLIEPYDVQETRRLEREKTEKETREKLEKETREKLEKMGILIQAEREKAQAERERARILENLIQAKEKEMQEAIRKAVQAEREKLQAGKAE